MNAAANPSATGLPEFPSVEELTADEASAEFGRRVQLIVDAGFPLAEGDSEEAWRQTVGDFCGRLYPELLKRLEVVTP